MTAMTVTPEIVRVAFLRKTGRSLRFCCGFSWAIISGLDGICLRWCLAAVLVFSWCRSFCVGFFRSIKASMISCMASSKSDLDIRF
jgi:hypothetical protein